METSILHARVPAETAQQVALLAAMRKIRQQDVIESGVRRELEAAPELPEILRILCNGNDQDNAQ